MPLELTARLDQATVEALLAELFPTTIELSEPGEERGTRWLHVDRARAVAFVAGQGLKIVTSARVKWKAAGVGIPVTLKEIELLLRPAIDEDERGKRLLFVASVERADFKMLPGFIDRRIQTGLNDALGANGDRFAWRFGETLGQAVGLPSTLRPIEALVFSAERAEVEVASDALVLRVDVGLSVARRDGPDDDGWAL